MEFIYGLIAEYISADRDNRVNILATYEVVAVQRFPYLHRRLYLAVTVSPTFGETDAIQHLQIQFVDEDGVNHLAPLDIAMKFPTADFGPKSHTVIHFYEDLQFTRPGRYEFRVSSLGQPVGAFPLFIIDESSLKFD